MIAAGGLLALAAGNFAASRAMRTGRVHRYLTARLESAFGRTVEVGQFDLRLSPSLRIEAQSVTVGEDPAFGHEYFLRAERVTAGLRWTGLLRGRFELNTFSFTRPSVTLVRNGEGRWNLERWLPPASPRAASAASLVGPMPAPARPLRLERVQFEDGRMNFMSGAEKLAFALTGVNGSVEQEAPGRWKLRLEAQPWRSGATLQAAGRVSVRGEIAGTSARLQPAEIHVHWGRVSLADLLRLARGEDFGLRGEAALDATLRSKARNATDVPTGEWLFNVQVRAREIHRWDLTGRQDNPAINLLADGVWNVPENRVSVKQLVLEGPRSNARGEADFFLSGKTSFEVRLDSAVIRAADVLTWYRAFRPGVAEGVSADGFLTGAAVLDGWPLTARNVAFSSDGGRLTVPGLAGPVRISAFGGGRTRDRIALEAVKILLPARKAARKPSGRASSLAARGSKHPAPEDGNALVVSASHDVTTGTGYLSLNGSAEHAEDVLALTAALGRPLQRGWELQGKAEGSLRWTWGRAQDGKLLNGHIDFSGSKIQVAGLNLPLELNDAQLAWKDGQRRVRLAAANVFGATWDGELEEDQPLTSQEDVRGWKFRLHADRLNATELDRWVGPRARPNWLERLLPSLLGSVTQAGTPQAGASELIRKIRAAGEVKIDELRIEKLQLSQVQARAALHDFELEVEQASARWAGGVVRGSFTAGFAPRPRYAVDAKFERVRLTEVPAIQKEGERFNGSASGEIRLAAEGVGRDELLRTLDGDGRIKLRNVEFRGWDVAASLDDGAPQTGSSRWPAGEGAFSIQERRVSLDSLRLDSPQGTVLLRGTVNFGGGMDLSIRHALERVRARTSAGERAATESSGSRILKITGLLDVPRVSVDKGSL